MSNYLPEILLSITMLLPYMKFVLSLIFITVIISTILIVGLAFVVVFSIINFISNIFK